MLFIRKGNLSKMMQWALILFICLLTNVAYAQLKPAEIFANNAILQEGMYIPIWGTGDPRALVKVSFANDSTQVFSDSSGRWLVYLPPMEADGKSYRLDIKSGHEEIIYNNVMLGEVWLASGQSNMEKTVGSGVGTNTNQIIADANYPTIRYFQVPRQTSRTPLEDFSESPQWIKITPETVKTLSAVAYFFGRELHLNKNVPVGIISSSWGATSAEAWISEKMLSTMPGFREEVQNIDHNRQHWDAFVAQNLKADHDRDSIANISNNGLKLKVNSLAYNDSSWTKTQYPLDMQKIGLNGFWGIVWFRKSFNLPEKPKGKTFKIMLNMTARDVVIYLNGIQIGHTINPDRPMNYPIAGKLLKRGKNVLSVRMYVNWGSAYIGTPQTEAFISSPNSKIKIPLEGEWRSNGTIESPVAQWQNYYNQLAVQYNGRIAPLIPYAIRGVIWYQGENNASKAYQYRTLFPLLIEDWRIRWKEGYMPFLFVQLPNYKQKVNTPSEDDWAYLREAQAMALRYPNTGMACTIDIGDANNIHPTDKMDVGHRLYLAACKVAYHENIISSGPIYKSMIVEGNKIRLKFSSCGEGLVSKNNEPVKGFAIAGKDHTFYWATAAIDGNEIIVSSSHVNAPIAVRYGWAANPDCNLYNKEGLPAPPFRTDDWFSTKQ